MNELPSAFEARMQQQILDDYPHFKAAIADETPISIRLNSKKQSLAFENDRPVKWCETGKYLTERPNFAQDPLWHGGAYYVQEASSMLIEQAIRQWVLQGKNTENKTLRVLDLCASPGGKTTLVANLLPEGSLLVANEIVQSRVSVLRENLSRWGVTDVVITNHDAADFVGLEGFFDVVLIDAPCSGEGLFRKTIASRAEWSLANCSLCVSRQRDILQNAVRLVADGGVLIYSTCTYNPAENDGNMQWLNDNFEVEPLSLATKIAWKVQETGYGYECLPHRTEGEGFYMAGCTIKNKLSANYKKPKKPILPFLDKASIAISQPFIKHEGYDMYQRGDGEIVLLRDSLFDDYTQIGFVLAKRGLGIGIGEVKNKVFIPSHQLAMNNIIHKNLPAINLDLPNALRYLQKVDFEYNNTAQKGWNLMQYQNINLGWAKILDNRVNNYLPNEWKLRKII